MTVVRFAAFAVFGLSVTAAAAKTPETPDLKHYVGQRWMLHYPAIPCSNQVAEVSALDLVKQKGEAPKAAKGETVEVEPPGTMVTFTVRCSDGNSYSGKVSLRYLSTVFTAPAAE